MIKRPLSLQVLILLIGIICILLGSLVLVGYYTRTVELIQVLPMLVPAHCQKIVDFHEGNTWLTSESGKGSTFFFTIKK